MSVGVQPATEVLAAAFVASGLGIVVVNPDGRYGFSANLPKSWPVSDAPLLSDVVLFGEELGRQIAEQRALSQRQASARVQTIAYDDGRRETNFELRHMPSAEGMVMVVSDCTEAVQREKAITNLLREVSHRSKNMLAIVQSVAMQTARHAESIDEYVASFRGRLHALSATQDLVTEADWRGARLRDLVLTQMTRVGGALVRNVLLEGADPMLCPNAALHVGLALHELASNATRHGTFAKGQNGEVTIRASLDDADSILTLEWIEDLVGHAIGDVETRFGRLMLERIVPLSVDGDAELTVEPDQLRYRLSLRNWQPER